MATRNTNHRFIFAIITFITILFLGSCSDDEFASRVFGANSETSTRPELIQEILTEGGLVLPPNTEVLLAHYEHGIDTAYRIALRMSPQDVTTFLTNSHITTPPISDSNPITMGLPFAEPNMDSSPSLLFISADPKPAAVPIDQRDNTNHYIHLWFGT
ncbi:MAG: hypothetical protein ACRCSF_10645 [Mycobacteriaceae bacterium]